MIQPESPIIKFINYYQPSRIKVHIMECKTLYCMSKKSLLIIYSKTLHVQEVWTIFILYCLQEYILCVQEVQTSWSVKHAHRMRIFWSAKHAHPMRMFYYLSKQKPYLIIRSFFLKFSAAKRSLLQPYSTSTVLWQYLIQECWQKHPNPDPTCNNGFIELFSS